MATDQNTLGLYLSQYLKTVGGNVFLSHSVGGHSMGGSYFLVFKCKVCSQNWHVGRSLFLGTTVPSELAHFVKQHKHICTKFTNLSHMGVYTTTGVCQSCGWPYPAHEESWDKNPVVPEKVQSTNIKSDIAIKRDIAIAAAKYGMKIKGDLPEIKVLDTPKGRKFRTENTENTEETKETE